MVNDSKLVRSLAACIISYFRRPLYDEPFDLWEAREQGFGRLSQDQIGDDRYRLAAKDLIERKRTVQDLATMLRADFIELINFIDKHPVDYTINLDRFDSFTREQILREKASSEKESKLIRGVISTLTNEQIAHSIEIARPSIQELLSRYGVQFQSI